jgi:hypothetical protein
MCQNSLRSECFESFAVSTPNGGVAARAAAAGHVVLLLGLSGSAKKRLNAS